MTGNLEQIMKLFGRDLDIIKKEMKEKENTNCCNHEYIPLFTTYSCKHCGKEKVENND